MTTLNEPYSIVIDSNMNIYKVKEKKMIECFDKLIAPLDIYSQVGNETEEELAHELGLDYVKALEDGLMKALDELSQKSKKLNEGFDYDFENCKNESEYKEICDKVLTLANELVEKLDNHYDKLNDIDEYIGYYIDNSIDYENLKFYLKRDNMFTRELEDWLENYMRYYNKKEKINVWEE